MNDGLVCELARLPGSGDHGLFIVDPVANARGELPALPTHSWADGVTPTTLVSVDNVACNFMVYLMVYTNQAETMMYVYESYSSEWRGLASPQEEEGLADAASAVVFHGILFVVFNTPHPNEMCSLLSYNLQEDMWRVLDVDIPRCCQEEGPDPHVFVYNNQLWMSQWYRDPEYLFMEDNMFFKNMGIRIIDNSVDIEYTSCFELARSSIDAQFHEPYYSNSFVYCFPFTRLDNDPVYNTWNAMIWMSDLSGKVVVTEREDESDRVDVLPAHPVGQSNGDMAQSDMSDEEDVIGVSDSEFSYYRAWYMNLSMRNVLSPGPAAIDPHAR